MKSIFKFILIKILNLESKLIINKYKPKIIAVTGSVGKTSTKDAIFTILSKKFHIRKSEKSYNSDLGIPLTIIGCENGWNNPIIWLENIFHGLELIIFKSKYPEYLVLEIGADQPNDIKKIVDWLKPDISVITKVSEIPVHVEFFKSPDEVLNEKLHLIRALKKDGFLILPADDNRVMDSTKEYTQKKITFGIDNYSDINANNISFDINTGTIFKLNYLSNNYSIILKGALGKQFIYPSLAGIAVGIAMNMNIEEIISAISNHIPSRGRMNILNGINNSYLIDDTYNSSPDAVHEALNVMQNINCLGKKIAILGDMMELGKFSIDEHKKVGEHVKKTCDILITVGPRSKQMDYNSMNFNNSIDAGEYVKAIISQNDIVLIKGSQSIRLERATKILLANPDKANDLLVRQEAEWVAKK